MIAYVYRSLKRDGLYLYLSKRDDFKVVPTELMGIFGKPVFALMFLIEQKKQLALVDINKVKHSLVEDGFYLQLPPMPEDLLKKMRSDETIADK